MVFLNQSLQLLLLEHSIPTYLMYLICLFLLVDIRYVLLLMLLPRLQCLLLCQGVYFLAQPAVSAPL